MLVWHVYMFLVDSDSMPGNIPAPVENNKEEVRIENSNYIDIIIHGKLFDSSAFRLLLLDMCKLLWIWVVLNPKHFF